MTSAFSNEWDKGSVDGACAKLDGGKLRIYDGTRPASVGDAVTTQTLLVELTMNSPAFSASSGTPPTASFIGPVNAVAANTGTATWFRAVTSGGATLFDGDVSESGGGGDAIISDVDVVSGQTVNLVSLGYSQS